MLKDFRRTTKTRYFHFSYNRNSKVPITVLSRCQRFDFQRISDEIITDLLKNNTKRKISIEEEVINEIAKCPMVA